MHKKRYIIPVFIPFLGCPHDCAFCNQVKITDYNEKPNFNSIKNQIDNYIKYLKDENIEREIAFYGGSFTGIKKDELIEYLKIAKDYKDKKIVSAVRCSTRPDYIDDEILLLLKKYEVDTIELGIQSMNDEVLKYNQRGHSVEDSIRASNLIKKYNFNLGHQLMPGLYMDTRQKDIDSAIKSVKLKPDFVRIYPTLVIKDTLLNNLYCKGLYTPLSLKEAIDISTIMYMIYTYRKIDVIRIGLQTTENINYGKDVVSGPFHPAIRQMVESNLMKYAIEEKLKFKNISNIITFKCNGRNISIINGNKKSNQKYFWNKYRIKFKFEEINSDKIILKIDEQIDEIKVYEFIKRYVEKNYGGDLL
ncbi:MAG: radical SAM protein [Peptoniphilaceae bacterium]|nr:radical SAM protein [Peptoniphilaceae bacterium]MDD7382841.1 radical SAM protein [Peptoniphilaceae bacterium]